MTCDSRIVISKCELENQYKEGLAGSRECQWLKLIILYIHLINILSVKKCLDYLFHLPVLPARYIYIYASLRHIYDMDR